MRQKRAWLAGVLAALILGVLIHSTKIAMSCGPFFPTAYFTYSLHPDFPLENYARGQLGVVQPTYAKSYLYVAYRYLSGKKLDADEQKAVLSLWQDRLASVSFGAPETAEPKTNPWAQQWIDARKQVPGSVAVESIDTFRQVGQTYMQFMNCTDDGFRTAIATLNQRIGQFGAASPAVKDWLGAQDQVFANCTSQSENRRPAGQFTTAASLIPTALASGAPGAARADRDYQIAAAYFYAAEYDEAAKRFEAIAKDSSSPWRQVARLLVVRCLIRKTTLSAEDDKYDKTPLVQAAAQLQQIIQDPAMGEVHASAERLLDFVEYRVHPLETERRLASQLMQGHPGANLKQNLWDYTLLVGTALPADNSAGGESAPSAKVDVGEGSDLSDWINTFVNAGPGATSHAIERWRQTKSVAWLAIAIGKVGSQATPKFRKGVGLGGAANATPTAAPANPAVAELMKAAEAVPPDSPGYATIAYHRLRLIYQANRSDDVRAQLDKLLSASGKTLPTSALNLFLGLRMRVSNNLEDLLRFAQRVPATVSYDTEGLELPDDLNGNMDAEELKKSKAPRFDADATTILNQMLPLDMLAQAAESKVLNDDLRRQVAMATWVRAILLDNRDVAARMVPVVETLEPSVKDLMETYRAEKSPEAAEFAAESLMLKFPGTRPVVDTGASRTTAFNKIDDFRDNWWCLAPQDSSPDSAAPGDDSATGMGMRVVPQIELRAPAFLPPQQKAQGEKEWKNLQAVGVAPNFLAKEVVAWGKLHPDDPRVPEALYLAVRATRYGCTDKATGTLSKAAFQLLHGQYPKSDWAGKTKYWYGGDSTR